LYYYYDEKSSAPNGVIELEGCEVVKDITRKKHCFQISHKTNPRSSRMYHIFAKNDLEMKDWVKVISAAIHGQKEEDTNSNLKNPHKNGECTSDSEDLVEEINHEADQPERCKDGSSDDSADIEILSQYEGLARQIIDKLLAQVEPHGSEASSWRLVKDEDVLISVKDGEGSFVMTLGGQN